MADQALKLTLAQARRAWLVRQRLVPGLVPAGPLAGLVGAIGWIPVPTGCTTYLALWARGALQARAPLDQALFEHGEVVLVPGPRGSTWLVPAADGPLARAFALADHASREARVASACGLTARDLEASREALRKALETPQSPEEIRNRLADNVVRPLGEVGRKAGSSTLAGLVLRHMWILGEVARVPVEGRLDRERHRYVLDPRPRRVPTAAEAVDVIAPRWLAAHAPTTAKIFATTFGIATGRALAALRPVKTQPVEIEGLGPGYLAPEDFTVPDEAPAGVVSLLPVRDPLLDAHPSLVGLTAPAVARAAMLRSYGSAPSVLLDGEIVGLWVHEEPAQRVGWRALVPVSPEAIAPIEAATRDLARFIAEQLGTVPLHTAQVPRRIAPLGGEISTDV